MARPTKYHCNENYFQTILDSRQAYILGFIWADGSVNSRTGIRIMIKKGDVEILKFIKKELKSDAPIRVRQVSGRKYVDFAVNRQKLNNDLFALGITPNKSENNCLVPRIAPDLLPHFLRGLFDGDGSIWKASGWKANFTGGYDFLTWIKSVLNEAGISGNKIRHRYSKTNLNSCMLDFSGGDTLLALKNYLYRESTFQLTRKKSRFNKAEQYYKKLKNNLWKSNGNDERVKSLIKEGKKAREIANLLNLNHNSVRSRMVRLRAEI
jgi:hypothetical protein